MKLTKKGMFWSAVAAVLGSVTVRILVRRQTSKPPRPAEPKLKTIADIKPPRVVFKGYDESKMRPVTYANNLRGRLIDGHFQAKRPTGGGRGSFDCPVAAGI